MVTVVPPTVRNLSGNSRCKYGGGWYSVGCASANGALVESTIDRSSAIVAITLETLMVARRPADRGRGEARTALCFANADIAFSNASPSGSRLASERRQPQRLRHRQLRCRVTAQCKVASKPAALLRPPTWARRQRGLRATASSTRLPQCRARRMARCVPAPLESVLTERAIRRAPRSRRRRLPRSRLPSLLLSPARPRRRHRSSPLLRVSESGGGGLPARGQTERRPRVGPPGARDAGADGVDVLAGVAHRGVEITDVYNYHPCTPVN